MALTEMDIKTIIRALNDIGFGSGVNVDGIGALEGLAMKMEKALSQHADRVVEALDRLTDELKTRRDE